MDAHDADWPWWGGPRWDWKPATPDLADTWPESGPPVLWRRPLGEGYSAISVRDGNLYTMSRNGEEETVIAMAAADGKTLWQFTYAAPTAGFRFDRGAGPHATPAVTADRVFAIGSTGEDARARSRDRRQAVGARPDRRAQGRRAAPRLLVEPADPRRPGDRGGGRRGRHGGRVQAEPTAAVAWRGGADDSSYSSPLLIDLGGERQLVVFASTRIIGFDPDDGKELWSHPHLTTTRSTSRRRCGRPHDGILFMSSAYDGGGRAIQLTKSGDATTVKELWFSNQVRIHFGTAVRLDDTVYASSGDFGPAPMTAVDVKTGEVLWRDRTFAKHSLLYADGKLVLLDEDGALALVEVNRQGMTVKARAQVFNSLSWTVPTLVGTRLYLRNREEIVALELGAPSARSG